MIIGAMIILFVLSFIFYTIATASWEHEGLFAGIGTILLILALGVLIFGCLHGFINYPPTEGTHQGVITAVDLEGNWFRRYEVYLKSSGYTAQSDETVYLVYDINPSLNTIIMKGFCSILNSRPKAIILS